MTTQPLNPLDAAWYHMDGPANPAIVTGLAITRRPLDYRRVREALRRRLLHFERFRQRVVERGTLWSSPRWEDAPDLDLDHHVRHAALPAPGDEAALRALVQELASQPLDHSRPLWQAHVIDNVMGGSAFVLRYHHCIGDGSAMMMVATRLFDMPPHAAAPPRQRLAHEPSAGLLDQAIALAAETGAVVSDLVKWPDPKWPLKGEFAAGKSVAWSDPVAIEDVKSIGAPSGAKINDVLVAAVAGALRRDLRRRGVEVDRASLRAMVPLDLRTPEQQGELGNRFGLMILDLPVSASKASDRLARTKAGMDALKHSAEGPAMQLLLDIFGRTPKVIEDIACEIFGSKASLVLTNVVGPRDTIGLAGEKIERMMFCVPHPGEQIGMGISIFSYCGTVTLTVIADAGLVPAPQKITKAFNQELAAMLRHTRRTHPVGAATG